MVPQWLVIIQMCPNHHFMVKTRIFANQIRTVYHCIYNSLRHCSAGNLDDGHYYMSANSFGYPR